MQKLAVLSGLLLVQLAAGLLILPRPPAAGAGAPHTKDELIVIYTKAISPGDRERVSNQLQANLVTNVDRRTDLIRIPASESLATATSKARAVAHVSSAKPNYLARISDSSGFIPNDPGQDGPGGWSALQWDLVGPFGINIASAWSSAINGGTPGGHKVTVAVLDTGVAYRDSRDGRYRKAPDLNRKRFVRGYDFVDDDRYPYDSNGHGTLVTALIAASTNNGVGLAGTAYRARVMPVRVLNAQGVATAARVTKGIRFAARHGAQIINMSFNFPPSFKRSDIPSVISALREADRRGVVLVAAAGNEGVDRVAYPAKMPPVVAVGATTEHGCRAVYSNAGHNLDLVAPGGGADFVISGDPNCAPDAPAGRPIFQSGFLALNGGSFGIQTDTGTSFAAPHVSGVAALIIASRAKSPSPASLADRLRRSARDLGSPGYDFTYGAGLLDASAAMAP
jgi:serine protease